MTDREMLIEGALGWIVWRVQFHFTERWPERFSHKIELLIETVGGIELGGEHF